MARRKSAPRVKLEHRLPNPPALFVGRERELDWLTGALGRAPVVVLAGPGGIGKTALALRLMHERFKPRVKRTVYFEMRPGAPTAQLRFDLVRVLAQTARAELDLNEIASDPEALTEAAIDVAEDAELWVVIDDAHHADATEMNELLTMLASYARDSRWIVTSRMEPRARALSGQVLMLGGIGDASLVDLARRLGSGGDEADLHRAVAAAAGSPWFLQQYVSAGESGVELTRERLLENLPPAADAFLRVLGILREPFPEEVLAALAPLPDEPTLGVLERRGLLQRGPVGLRLHDVVTGWLNAPSVMSAADVAEHERVAEGLATVDDPRATVEAARLYRDAGALDALAALLDARAERLFAQAQAPRLWVVIGEVRDPRLVRHQLRCAAELGNPTALAAVSRPQSGEPEERLAWAATLYAQGEVSKAQSLVGEIQDAPDEVAIRAALLRARCLLHDGQVDRVLFALGELAIDDPRLAFRRDALVARAHATRQRPEAEALIAELRRRSEAMVGELEALRDVAVALYLLGRRAAADEMLERLAATPRGGRASLLVARSALLARARIRLEAGELHEAAALIDAIRPYVRSTSLLRPFLLELDAARRLAIGDLSGLEGVLETAAAEARAVDRALAERVGALSERLGLLRGDLPAAATELAPAGADGEARRWIRLRRELRCGLTVGPEPATTTAAGRVESSLFAADHALLEGRAAAAVEHAARAAHEAARAEDRPLELEAFTVECDARLVAGPPEAHAAATRALVDRARLLSSARARLGADLHERFTDPGLLEQIAADAEVSPVAARRARALLGGAPPLDAVDRLVLAAMRAHDPTLVVQTLVGRSADWQTTPWRTGWGLDARRRAVWLGDGRTVDLSGKALPWKLLVALLDARGRPLSKEALVLGVWEERAYHPGRHDPRVHMSMRKLRELLEEDASAPTRLLTTADGYRLGGVVRFAGEPAVGAGARDPA